MPRNFLTRSNAGKAPVSIAAPFIGACFVAQVSAVFRARNFPRAEDRATQVASSKGEQKY